MVEAGWGLWRSSGLTLPPRASGSGWRLHSLSGQPGRGKTSQPLKFLLALSFLNEMKNEK